MSKYILFILAFFHLFTSSLEAQNAPQALISSLQEHVRKDNFGRSFPKFGYVLTLTGRQKMWEVCVDGTLNI